MKAHSISFRFSVHSALRFAVTGIVAFALADLAFGQQQISDAVYRRDLQQIRTLAAQHPDWVSSKDSRGDTPLHIAARLGYQEVAEVLISSHADLNAKNNKGETPLLQAVTEGQKAIAELLLAHKADVSARDNTGNTALHAVASQGRFSQHLAEVMGLKESGDKYDRKDIAELLLAHGADVNAADNHGVTPLIEAALLGSRNVLEFLLASKADVRARTEEGVTALEASAIPSGSTPGQKEIMQLLLTHKADINATDNKGLTTLHVAAGAGNKEVVEFLLANKADVNAKDHDGKTPLGSAIAKAHEDVAQLLRQHGGHE